MGRFARSQSGAAPEQAARQVPVAARPRFIEDPQVGARDHQIKPQSFVQPNNLRETYQTKSQFFKLDRRKRKSMKIMGLAVLLLAGLGAGWILGKAVMGPSQIGPPQTGISAESVIEDKSYKSVAETAAVPDLESKAEDVPALQSESQGQSAQDDRVGRARNSGSARRSLATSKARGGPGIGIVTKPIKVVFRPLKKINPFKLRLW